MRPALIFCVTGYLTICLFIGPAVAGEPNLTARPVMIPSTSFKQVKTQKNQKKKSKKGDSFFKKAITKGWPQKEGCWVDPLEEAFEGLKLKPIPSLAKDSRCRIDVIEEDLLKGICDATSNDPFVASAKTIRFANALRCLSPTSIVALDRGIANYLKARLKNRDCARGIACMANAAVLVVDMFPNPKASRVQKVFETNRLAITSAIELHGNDQVGLWCPDHRGTTYQYRERCTSTPGSGKITETCINPLAQIVRSYGDKDSALRLGLCSCQEMIENNGICDLQLPPCLKEAMSDGMPLKGSGPSTGLQGTEASPSEEPDMGGVDSGDFTLEGPSMTDTALSSFYGSSYGPGQGSLTDFIGQFSEQDLRLMGCTQQGMSDFMNQLGSFLPSGRCNFRSMMKGISQLGTGGKMRAQMNCFREAYRSRLMDQMTVRENPQYMDPGCTVMDGEGNEKKKERQPPPSRPATEEERRRNEETARQAANRLNSNNNTDGRNLLVMAGGNEERRAQAVARAQQAGNQARVSDQEGDMEGYFSANVNNNTGAVTQPKITIDADQTSNSGVMAHEMYHVAALILTDGTITEDQAHETMSNHLRNPPGTRTPCPDCPDDCAGEDLRNNELFQCMDIEGDEDELIKQPGLDPWIYPDPEAPGDPGTLAGVEALLACTMAGGRQYTAGDGCGPEMQPGPDDPDCGRRALHGSIGTINAMNEVCWQIECGEGSQHPCCGGSLCPEGSSPAISPQGIICEPPSGVPTPGGDPEMMFQFNEGMLDRIEINRDGETTPSGPQFEILGEDEEEEDGPF